MVVGSAPALATGSSFPGVVTTFQTDFGRPAAKNPRAAVGEGARGRSRLAAGASAREDEAKSFLTGTRRSRRQAAEESGMLGRNPATGQSQRSGGVGDSSGGGAAAGGAAAGGAAAGSPSSQRVRSRPQSPDNHDPEWIAFCRRLAESPPR